MLVGLAPFFPSSPFLPSPVSCLKCPLPFLLLIPTTSFFPFPFTLLKRGIPKRKFLNYMRSSVSFNALLTLNSLIQHFRSPGCAPKSSALVNRGKRKGCDTLQCQLCRSVSKTAEAMASVRQNCKNQPLGRLQVTSNWVTYHTYFFDLRLFAHHITIFII
jgi:hypothetical protein